MKHFVTLATALTLVAFLPQSIAAQSPNLCALKRVQHALHATEDARLELLASGQSSTAIASVDSAIRLLSAARETLRTQIRTGDPVLIRADKWTEWQHVQRFLRAIGK